MKETLTVTFIKRSYIIFVWRRYLSAVLWTDGTCAEPLSAFGVCGDEDGCEVLVDSKNVI
ncbi:hypothetical protein BA011_19965 [Rhizobium leguminosarum]|uniref:Uncharacterized protein n=1 Tax=Rhizobium leguminosarum TaxID=384 RepID=A0A1B1CC64_RHILE|nr:hypothetical protein BA011_15605 [Rhizobium leguminosarum]ANP87357.1 hypothetical protein BA011_17585 [Rhizobium leguminosarum]ANP87781.1 hypothetical protein BA011_19965 [Rhizobium leguminosarum]